MFAACNSATPQICTLAGCRSGVAVIAQHLTSDARSVRLCVDERCKTEHVSSPAQGTLVTVACEAEPATVRVAFEVRDQARKIVFEAKRRLNLKLNQPNGPDCKPKCWIGRLRLDPGSGRLKRF